MELSAASKPWTRRAALLGAAGVSACGGPRRPRFDPPTTLAAAVAGAWREPMDRARDPWRHPLESLTFWGLKPGQSVLEFWPGAGWYSDILAPFLAATGGKLYAANIEANDPASLRTLEAYRQHLAAQPKLFGMVTVSEFGARSRHPAPAGTIDLALFLRNLHNWMAAGIAEKAFRDAFVALKPGGFLGVEEHRAAPGGVQDVLASDGYVQQAYVVQMAQEAGFKLVATSEINANPADTKTHPFGVWTLPPIGRSSPRGQPDDPTFDHKPFDVIGESDRMTLRFQKPA